MTTGPSDLAAAWRDRAGDLRPYAPAAAVAWERAADELDEALREAADESLTIGEAAAESGYSERRLRELIAAGQIPQAGRRHAPRIRRGDLPRRPGRTHCDDYDPHADAAELLAQQRVS
jgi:hypothetical protein